MRTSAYTIPIKGMFPLYLRSVLNTEMKNTGLERGVLLYCQ